MKNRRILLVAATILSIVLSLLVLTVFGLPALLKSKIPALIEQETGRKTSLEQLQLTFHPLSLTLYKLAIQEKSGQPFASFQDLFIKINAEESIKQSTLIIEQIRLSKPYVHIAKLKKGGFNFSDLSKAPEKPETSDIKIFPVSLAMLALTDGEVVWEDASFAKPIHETLTPVKLELQGFSTTAQQKARLNLSFSLKSGGHLNWQGDFGLSPLSSEGKLELDKLNFKNLLAILLPDNTAYSLDSNAKLSSDYKLSFANHHLELKADKAQIELSDFKFEQAGSKLQVAMAKLGFETDFSLGYGEQALQFSAKKSKISAQDVQFSGLAPDTLAIKAASLSHETDLKLSQDKYGWQFSADKSQINLGEVQISRAGAGKLSLKLGKLSHEMDFQAGLTPKNWQLSIKNNRLKASALDFEQAKIGIKIPAIDLAASLKTGNADAKLKLALSQGQLSSQDLQFTDLSSAKTLVTLPQLALSGIGLNLENQELHIDSVTAKDAEFLAWLNADGMINYQTLGSGNAAQDKPASGAPAANPWSITVKQLALSNFGLDFEDRSLDKPLAISAKPINFKLSDYSNKSGAKLPMQLDLGFNKTGSIKIQGDTVIQPFTTQLNLDIKDIELDKFQPYLTKFARLDLIDGQFNLKGGLSVSLQDPGKPDIKFKGDTSIAKLLTRDRILHKDFIKWDNLRLSDLDLDVLARRYKAKSLVLNKPYARVTIKKDKTINFADVLIEDKKSPTKPSKSKTPEKAAQKDKPVFYLDQVQVIDGSSDFSDLSLILPFSAQIKSLDGGASGISSDQNAKIRVNLKGNAYDLAPVDIQGDISPYVGDFNMALNFDGMPMPLVSPYMVQFAGYKVEKGKMSLGLKYALTKGELNASNSVAMDQFELGEKVENPNAVSLPLELAVTLLKDSYGKIKVDVPITGSLNDPKFSVAHVIGDALINVITKAVTSPFRAIASLIGSEEDLSTVSFEPGKSTLDKKQYRKLTDLAKALKERPILNLEIKGAVYQEQDWPTLRENALYDQLKIMKANELNKNSAQKTLPEYVQISFDDYKRLLTELFFEQFPLLAKKNLFGTPSLLDPKGGDFYEVAKQKLAVVISPQQERLKDLAAKRAQAIASYIVQTGGVPNERVYILDTVIDPEREKTNEILSFLSLKSK